ncbi:Gpi1-domain-containing protein [Basidiobolus meristosporus CBS 931.73]|uniref:Gpi1-domain-containing protein n=1 Tax=Basidiobolus meristosporus CBS 931.73 TaxID=1314790 RepID=A0A1Y1YJV7_9FUNG|nr:Gpi1-domain-containing protein [Basidiobolus meristosporus CBS 931.73]|eukprot:ORX98268.1 Gpi1-domain-containing protein [Basidiobolus meristosporus CBS 931.73]
MSSGTAVSKIFWPTHVCSGKTKSGFLVGWNVRSFTACVAAVIQDVELPDLERFLGNLSSESYSEYDTMLKLCMVPPSVIGVFMAVDENEDDLSSILNHKGIVEKKQTANLWVTIQMQKNLMPTLRSVYCCGYRYHGLSSEIIFFKRPDPSHLQHLSNHPLDLDISKYMEQNSAADDAIAQITRKAKNFMLPNKRATHTHEKSGDNDMDVILNQINSSFDIERCIRRRCPKRNPMASQQWLVVWISSAACWLNQLGSALATGVSKLLTLVFAQPLWIVLFMARVLAELALTFLNLNLPPWLLNGASLKDLTATGQQIELRLRLACFWPWQYSTLRKKRWTDSDITRAHYINFYNSMWLVANDIMIGVAVGTFLINNSVEVTQFLMENLQHYTISSLEQLMVWLMGWPAGLKLNSELDKFLGELFLWLIHLWSVCIAPTKPLIPAVIAVIGLFGMFGCSMILALMTDLLSLLTLHIYWFYLVAARIYNWQSSVLYSLFNLFRGKKYNPLRKRTDSCDYGLDQLLIGTILFTLLTFLFPTIVVYYLTFLTGRLGVVFLQISFGMLLALLNHFPIFAIMLRILDPEKLPGGLKLDICDSNYILRQRPVSFHLARAKQYLKSRLRGKTRTNLGHIRTGREKSSKDGISSLHAPKPIHPAPGYNERDRERDRDQEMRYRGKQRTYASVVSSERVASPPSSQPKKITYLFIRNMPIPIMSVFFQYTLLLKEMRSQYLSLYVLRCLLTGEMIKPVPKLQYPMLPERRQSLEHFWYFLKGNLTFHRGNKESPYE